MHMKARWHLGMVTLDSLFASIDGIIIRKGE